MNKHSYQDHFKTHKIECSKSFIWHGDLFCLTLSLLTRRSSSHIHSIQKVPSNCEQMKLRIRISCDVRHCGRWCENQHHPSSLLVSSISRERERDYTIQYFLTQILIHVSVFCVDFHIQNKHPAEPLWWITFVSVRLVSLSSFAWTCWWYGCKASRLLWLRPVVEKVIMLPVVVTLVIFLTIR